MQKKDISMTTKKRLAKIFVFTGEQEQQLEFARQNLCKATAFEPYASFQRLDRLAKGYLTSRDLLNFMKDNGIDGVEEMECKHVIKYFDSNGEGKLSYTDYLQMLLPCDQPYLRAAATQRPTYPIAQNEYLPFDVERLLAKLIQKELKVARESERLKQELAARYDYNLEHLYREVDDINYKYIDVANLKRFLIKTGVFPNDQLLVAIIRRFDLDADAKLKQGEFIEGIRPQQEYSKRQLKDKDTPSSVAASRILSAQKSSRSTMRSAKKSSRKGELSQSRNFESVEKSAKKSRLSQNASIRQSVHHDEEDKQLRSYNRETEELKADMLRMSIGSPQQDRFRSTYKANEGSPLRSKFSASQSQPLQETRSYHQEQLSPRQAQQSVLGRSNLGGSHYEARSPRGEEQRSSHSKEVDPSLIYLLRECFKEVLAIEGGLEQIKKELGVRPDFTLAGAFNIFTGYSQSRITANDLLYGLERLGVVCDVADAKLFVERYDADKDGRLGFWEFSNALMPIDPILRDDLERRKAQWDIGFESKEILRRVFRKLIDAECMLESIRQRISREHSVNLRKAFDSLDWLGRGFLTTNEFKRAFDWQSGNPSAYTTSGYFKLDSNEMEGFLRRFNKDKMNGRISLPEFLEELSPKCPEKPY